jgi:hypothetical protein
MVRKIPAAKKSKPTRVRQPPPSRISRQSPEIRSKDIPLVFRKDELILLLSGNGTGSSPPSKMTEKAHFSVMDFRDSINRACYNAKPTFTKDHAPPLYGWTK